MVQFDDFSRDKVVHDLHGLISVLPLLCSSVDFLLATDAHSAAVKSVFWHPLRINLSWLVVKLGRHGFLVPVSKGVRCVPLLGRSIHPNI